MNSYRWTTVLLTSLLMFGLTACSGPDSAENQTPQAPIQPEATEPIVPNVIAPSSEQVGQLQTVDLTSSMVTIRDADGADHTFSFSDSTEILGADAAQGLSTRQGNPVIVRYTEQDGRKMATRIEIVPK